MRRRAPLRPADAKNEGQRQLAIRCERKSFGAVAKRARCDEATIRRYVRGQRDPTPAMKERLEATEGIAFDLWEKPPQLDAYAGEDEPVTTKREPPATHPR